MSNVSLLVDCARTLHSALSGLDVSTLSGADAAALVTELALVEKACVGVKAVAADRAAACGAHRVAGYGSAGDWLARLSGCSAGEARDQLETAASLVDCPPTAAAVVAGELSMDQAREVTGAELAQPGCEGELLELARRASLAKLKDEARRRRHEVIGADELHRRQRKARSFRHWRTPLGTIGLAGELPPEVGVPIVNRLDAECDRIRSAAKKESAKTGGPLEPRRAYAADAFVKFVSGNGKGTASRADVVVVVDLRAFRRGHAERDEPCHIIGGGPIPVGVAKELARDAFIKAVIHDGVAIHTVKHFGRHINVALRTALELGDPPRFEGVECVEPDCDRRYHLEWDHVDPFANDGPTCFTNLQPRCWSDHRAKTERDRRAGLLNKRRKRSKEVRL